MPRRLVRQLPWINYDDFLKTEFSAYLSARRKQARPMTESVRTAKSKPDVISVTRADLGLVERYVKSREQRSDDATPDTNYIDVRSAGNVSWTTQTISSSSPSR